MKTKNLLLLIAFAATAALAQPAAHANGPRFIYEANTWPLEHVARRHSYNNLAPAAATVRAGSTPSGSSSVIGIDLARLKRAPAQMQMAPVMQPNVMAQFTPPSFNTAFGKPGALPMTANPKLMSVPAPLAPAKTHKTVSAPKTFSHSQNGFPKMVKRTRPSNAHPVSQIKSYTNGFESGSTAPSISGSAMNVEQRVGGKLLPK
ncbi:hypothetical protein KA344_13910 [bacterium]|nr:hypothetical protein [bacterium]